MKIDPRNNIANSSSSCQPKLQSSSTKNHFMVSSTIKAHSSSASVRFKGNIGLLQEFAQLSTSSQRRSEIESQLGSKEVCEIFRNFFSSSTKGNFISLK